MDHHRGYPSGNPQTSVATDMIGDVEAFHRKFQHGEGPKPRMLPHDLFLFRSGFHREEIQEYDDEQELLEAEAKMGDDIDPEVVIGCLERQLDALVDAAWVIIGTAETQFGAPAFREAWRRVVAANMSKVRADAGVENTVETGRNAAFDIVKPPGWVAPDHKDLVRDHAPLNGN